MSLERQDRAALERTRSAWDQAGAWSDEAGMHWTENALVRARLNQKASGDPRKDWVSATLERHLKDRLPIPRCLSLGCGRGGLERGLARLNAFRSCDAVDLSEASIQEARGLAQAEGLTTIRYEVQDLNRLDLEPGVYDAVWAHDALHHVSDLDGLFGRVAGALKPDGLFVFHEYVGPARFQFPERQKELTRLCFQLLPEAYRTPVPQAVQADRARRPFQKGLRWTLRRARDKWSEGALLATLQRKLLPGLAGKDTQSAAFPGFPSPLDVAAADPSEAIRSHEILPILSRSFELLELRPLGGNLLHFLLLGIAGHFREDDPSSLMWLRFLFDVEDGLLAMGDIPSDFVYAVARPLPNPAPCEPSV